MELRFKGAQPTLYKGNLTVRFKEIVKFPKDEAEYRLAKQPGMWEMVNKVVEPKPNKVVEPNLNKDNSKK